MIHSLALLNLYFFSFLKEDVLLVALESHQYVISFDCEEIKKKVRKSEHFLQAVVR